MFDKTKDITIEILGAKGEKRLWQEFFGRSVKSVCLKSYIPGTDLMNMRILRSDESTVVIIGGIMERTKHELKQINNEVTESLSILQKIHNDVLTARHQLEPELLEMTRSIRNTRMNTTIELNKALSSLREVRKFFLESDYKIEIQRMEAFVSLCDKINNLIKDGTVNAVCDVMIKLATKEVSDDKT